MKKMLSFVSIIAIICSLSLGLMGCNSSYHEIMSSSYRGNIEFVLMSGCTNSYDVVIYECDSGNGPIRIVHLLPILGRQSDSYSEITGHDEKCDGKWSRIFYGGYTVKDGTNSFTAGFNSVTPKKSGDWQFEACPGDVGRVKPFSYGQILYANMVLDYAVSQIRNSQHLTSAYYWNEKNQQCELVRVSDAVPVKFN
ncbi:MAG: hypothetical protein WC827_03095 [Candidatus Paceibacterota bacterium]|jgi:hypothetical protein